MGKTEKLIEKLQHFLEFNFRFKMYWLKSRSSYISKFWTKEMSKHFVIFAIQIKVRELQFFQLMSWSFFYNLLEMAKFWVIVSDLDCLN